ncbi:Piso0_005467 [Millerozyma farinosa CBS 7064]|uniref:Piso0_005467 protein n=1 Tax=Pichia sorbitophila (strain ATCC MYA-4447 / BCRC 22081 / CBS 7064 / NBRC 10061 / NRRL Y-12695) TaxID=559304 RepID=G8Y564_PICSO|nr:Piso0_005467 [Millerozyma farinosa CBS 7064]
MENRSKTQEKCSQLTATSISSHQWTINNVLLERNGVPPGVKSKCSFCTRKCNVRGLSWEQPLPVRAMRFRVDKVRQCSCCKKAVCYFRKLRNFSVSGLKDIGLTGVSVQ